jgi:hypothetical protein
VEGLRLFQLSCLMSMFSHFAKANKCIQDHYDRRYFVKVFELQN